MFRPTLGHGNRIYATCPSHALRTSCFPAAWHTSRAALSSTKAPPRGTDRSLLVQDANRANLCIETGSRVHPLVPCIPVELLPSSPPSVCRFYEGLPGQNAARPKLSSQDGGNPSQHLCGICPACCSFIRRKGIHAGILPWMPFPIHTKVQFGAASVVAVFATVFLTPPLVLAAVIQI